jgi:hypothetical protein
VSQQGKHRKFYSLIEDEDVADICIHWICSQKPSMRTAHEFNKFLVDEVYPLFGEQSQVYSGSERTASDWLCKLGFSVQNSSKRKGSIYVDGHEREDVVKCREGFVKRFVENYLPRMTHYSGDHMEIEHPPVLDGDEKEIILITHDESTFKANDDQQYVRLENDEQVLKPKGEGRGIMISDFLCHCHGKLIDHDDDARHA